MNLVPTRRGKFKKNDKNNKLYSILRGTKVRFTRQNINIERINNFMKFNENL